MEPIELFVAEDVEFQDIEVWDWITCGSWSRPRRVQCVEFRDGEALLFLAEPDESRATEGVRCMSASDVESRGGAKVYPVLRKLWGIGS